MKFLPLVWAGLWRKRTRTVFTLLAVMSAFALFGLLGFVDAGFAEMLATSHYDRLIINPAFGTPIPMAVREEIQRIPGIKKVAAMSGVFGTYRSPRDQIGVGFSDDVLFDLRDDLVVTRTQR